MARAWTKEEADAREGQRKEMLHLTEMIARYDADPLVDADVAPHLVGRRTS